MYTCCKCLDDHQPLSELPNHAAQQPDDAFGVPGDASADHPPQLDEQEKLTLYSKYMCQYIGGGGKLEKGIKQLQSTLQSKVSSAFSFSPVQLFLARLHMVFCTCNQRHTKLPKLTSLYHNLGQAEGGICERKNQIALSKISGNRFARASMSFRLRSLSLDL